MKTFNKIIALTALLLLLTISATTVSNEDIGAPPPPPSIIATVTVSERLTHCSSLVRVTNTALNLTRYQSITPGKTT